MSIPGGEMAVRRRRAVSVIAIVMAVWFFAVPVLAVAAFFTGFTLRADHADTAAWVRLPELVSDSFAAECTRGHALDRAGWPWPGSSSSVLRITKGPAGAEHLVGHDACHARPPGRGGARPARRDENGGVLVMARSRAGEWTLWRVGRHRLAWRPTRRAGLHPYNPFGLREDETAELLSWIGALCATIVVLPWRIVTNRWPVVAYVINPIGVEGRRQRTPPMPKAEAQALARRWAVYIERYGGPPAPADHDRSA